MVVSGFPGGKEYACQCRRRGVRSMSWEDPLKEGMAAHSSILAWEIPWTEEPGGLRSVGLQGVGHAWAQHVAGGKWLPSREGEKQKEVEDCFFLNLLCRTIWNKYKIYLYLCIFFLKILFIFWPHHMACEILVPQPGKKPTPSALEVQSSPLNRSGSPKKKFNVTILESIIVRSAMITLRPYQI